MKVEEWLGPDNELGIKIWNDKYRYKNETFDEWLDRVSAGNADLKQLIIEKKFLFGGRILANRGVPGRKTYSNCYVLEPPKDSIESIFDTAGKLARTFSYGGGAGIDISKLAPRGAKVNNTALETSGAVSFTDLYSMVTGLIGQHGRRGALMLSIADNHPDLEEFIKVKTDLNRVTKANMSVRISDRFMQAVESNKDWELGFYRSETDSRIEKTVKAQDVFKQLCDANYDYGEPGCLFWDTITHWNLLSECKEFSYAGTNPCAEEPLPAGGSCLLGSLNLAAFVDEDGFDYGKFRKAVHTAVYALNDVLNEGMLMHPLKEQRECVRKWRQIGLGIMGLADAFIKMGIRYGSKESIEKSEAIATLMATFAIQASQQYSLDHPECNVNKYLDDINHSAFFENLEIKPVVSLANTQLLTIAPTGSISTMIGVSGGIEPIFAKEFTRRTVSLGNKEELHTVHPDVIQALMDKTGCTINNLPDYVVTSKEIPCNERIDVQAMWQTYIDASISSTINLPEDTPRSVVHRLYMYAWEKKCKGITVFREGCKRDAILTTEEPKIVTMPEDTKIIAAKHVNKDTEDHSLIGKKRKLMTGCGSLHCVALFDSVTGDLKETYLNKGSTGGCNNFMVGLSRMMSLSARSGCTVDEIVDQLKSTGSCPSYAVRRATKGDTSKGSCCPMAIGNALIDMHDEIMREIEGRPKVVYNVKPNNPCPNCGAELEFSGGCNICKDCGWTKCD